MSYTPCGPPTAHSLASSSTFPAQLSEPAPSRPPGMLQAPNQHRPDTNGDAYIRDATPYAPFMDNSSTCDSPIARTATESTSAGGMNSNMQTGFASANSASASAPAAPDSSSTHPNTIMTFPQPSNNDQMLFEFDDFSQYLAFNEPHDTSLNDLGGAIRHSQVVSSPFGATDPPLLYPDSNLYPAQSTTTAFDTSPTDSIYSPFSLPLDGGYFLAHPGAVSTSAIGSASGLGTGMGANGAGNDGINGNTVGAWQSPTTLMHADFSPSASQPTKDSNLSPYDYSQYVPTSAVSMPISTGSALTLPDGSERPLALHHLHDGRGSADEIHTHTGEVPMLVNPGIGNVGDDTATTAGIVPTELAGTGDLTHQRAHHLRAVNGRNQQHARMHRPPLQRSSPRSRPQFVSQLWDTGSSVSSTGPLRVPHSYSYHGKSPSPEPYGFSHSRSRSRSSLSPTLAPSSPSNRTYGNTNLFAFPVPSSAPPQASVLRAAGRMRTYSQRGGAEALKAAASTKNEPLEYDFGAGMNTGNGMGLGIGVGMDLDSEYDPDPDATVRKKKRTLSSSASTVFGEGNSPRSSVEPALDGLGAPKEANVPLKSELKPPKLAPSTWQLYFTDWIQRHQLNSDKKLNVAQAAKEAGAEYASLTPEQKEPFRRRSQAAKEARERELAAWQRTLTPEAIKRENAYRAAQRKAGKSRKGNLKDPNAPKKPLSAYFMFLQHIRADHDLVQEVFGEEKETTAQSVLAAAKWRSMTDEERKPFLAQAEKEKLEYEAARRLYEEGTVGFESTINFNINTESSGDFINNMGTTFVIARPAEQSSDSDADSEDLLDEPRRIPNRG